MQKRYRLKRRNDFRRVFRAGMSVANRQFVLYVYDRGNDEPVRVGVSVSRKVGNAVTRKYILFHLQHLLWRYHFRHDKNPLVTWTVFHNI
ncbi:ribonuclease P protein component [Polycladomyces sp. WAk]|uniref:Ribonuclease P protein component n=1 Tax=Polycladomyces zharkentensis TaxID=2807616 RepID=A0ABS2WEY0_9BACL|nr:ribonuclease P protein component [Polycladomyces sp. WAk]MBN2908088.1 ribonuclease P protein component [Polycladomyces sp. WAk]